MCIIIYSKDEFYIVDVLPENAVVSQSIEMKQNKASADSLVLSKSDLKQVTLKCKTDGYHTDYTEVGIHTERDFRLYGEKMGLSL